MTFDDVKEPATVAVDTIRANKFLLRAISLK